MSLIDIKNLNLIYDSEQSNDVHALKDINLTIGENEFIVVLGASGCGKTSLLNLMAGFLFTDQGEIRINGKPITRPGPDRGVVFQENALMPWLNVRDNVALGLKFQGTPKSEIDGIIDRALSWVGLDDFKSHFVYQLSGGMQQRVGIARALASDPDILLMDEPLGALDAITRQDIQEVVLKVWEKTHKTIFMITHSIEEAIFMATRLIIMTPRPGKIYKSYDLDFGKRHLEGASSQELKSSKEFLELKTEIISIIEENSQ
jgi:taurine transport system ATP-binding protein